MKILVICQYYHPEPFRITDVCEELVRRGHEITVVTGVPNYPMGEIYEGYRRGKRRDEVINGVKVHRCFTIGRKGGTLKRFLNYFSYPLSATSYVRRMKEDFDAVLVNQLSPVMMAWPAIRYKKKHHKKVVMYCLDLWPASLNAGGVSGNSFVYHVFHRISADIYRQMDMILNTSRSFEGYQIGELKIDSDKIKYVPQYAETVFTPETCRKQPDGYIDLMFAGNIGAAQSMNTIIEAAKLTEDIGNLRWHIVGEGTEIDRIRKSAEGMEQVIFHGRQPLEKMPDYYAMADAMLVSIKRDPLISLTLPGKVQTYMAAGKPIIAAADGETDQTIREAGCGLCAPAEDAAALAECVRQYIRDGRTDEYGRNASAFYTSQMSKESFFASLEQYLS